MRIKTIAVFVLSCFLFLAIVVTLSLMAMGNQVEQQFEYEARTKTEVVAEVVRNFLIISDYHEVQKIAQSLIKKPNIKFIEIKNSFGDSVAYSESKTEESEEVFVVEQDITNMALSSSADKVGTIKIVFSYSSLRNILAKHFIIIGSSVIVLFLIVMVVLFFISKALVKYFVRLKANFELLKSGQEIKDTPNAKIMEFKEVTENLNDVSVTLIDLKKKEQERLKLQVISDVASQVAHDIRSPLSALIAVISHLKELPEEKRVLIRSAVRRIDDIANDLESRREDRQIKSLNGVIEEEEVGVHLLSGVVDSLVSEKRTQYRSLADVTIGSDLQQEGYGLFVSVQPNVLKRVLSNLINNSVEALDKKGEVVVTTGLDDKGDVYICVCDTGRGIPEEVIPKLMQKGFTYGKKGGSGLGLYHAKTTVNEWGGQIKIESEIESFTRVIITLPRQKNPGWFVPELILGKDTFVVVLDDDESIHKVWQHRLETKGVSKDRVMHFMDSESIAKWFYVAKETSSMIEQCLFLCDYELLDSKKSGLHVIEDLGIRQQAVLVTSRFEESNIRYACEALGIKMLPKNLAGYVPIKMVDELKYIYSESDKAIEYDLVLIDDDEMVHKTWLYTAKNRMKHIKVYKEYEDFLKDVKTISKRTPVYIDSNLGDGIKGEVLAKDIKDMAFEEVYLTTGTSKQNFENMPWLTDIVDKVPPFFKIP